MVKQISDSEIYLLIKYIKSVLWSVAKSLSYIEDARCLKVNVNLGHLFVHMLVYNKHLSFHLQGMNIKVWKNSIYILTKSSNDKIMKTESYQHKNCFILIALQFTALSELSSYRSILKYELSIYF